MNALLKWLDDRTGIRGLLHEALFERIPGGARWRYVWGSTLVFAFSVQMITGIVLWMCYSPSAQTAWESVFFIQYELPGGWLVRGLHHFMAQAMVVLLALHLLQVVVDGAYRAPREVNFWLGLILMKIVLALALTGYLLPWDQKGFWATRVATNLSGLTPAVGAEVQQMAVGGNDYGHYTLTRFFALHAGLLPALLVVFLALHIAVFRRHGIHAIRPRPDRLSMFWPDQVLRDGLACLLVLGVVLFLVAKPAILGGHDWQSVLDRPGEHLGAELGAPADPSTPYAAARPEWYFLFLFQFLKLFPGHLEVIGALVVPAAIVGFMFLMPFIGRVQAGHWLNVLFLLALLVGAGVLTGMAWWDDHCYEYVAQDNAQPLTAQQQQSKDYLEAVEHAESEAERVRDVMLERGGAPPAGALALARATDPQLPLSLFESHCASCHSHVDAQGQGLAFKGAKGQAQVASNLYGFASREWLAGLLDPAKIDTPQYFGGSEAHGGGTMSGFVKDYFAKAEKGRRELLIKALSAEAALVGQADVDRHDLEEIRAGRDLIAKFNWGDDQRCTSCHTFHGEGERSDAPTLTGYGSYEWLSAIVSDPNHADFYLGSNDKMPAFAAYFDETKNVLTAAQRDVLVRWLRGEGRGK